MLLKVSQARYLDAYRIEVTFNDGKTGIADLSAALTGPMFEPLNNPQAFAQFSVDAELETLVWQIGADLAPEHIYFQAFKSDTRLLARYRAGGYITE